MRTRPRSLKLRLVALVALVWIVGCNDNPSPPPPPPPPSSSPLPAVFDPVEVTGIGDVGRGSQSEDALVLRFTEPSPAAIGAGSGSLEVILTDAAGRTDTLAFTGSPSITAPDSLGVSAAIGGGNVLALTIVDSDALNREQITIAGLGIGSSSNAALGAINAAIAGCSGSLAGCTAATVLDSPGNVVAPP